MGMAQWQAASGCKLVVHSNGVMTLCGLGLPGLPCRCMWSISYTELGLKAALYLTTHSNAILQPSCCKIAEDESFINNS